VMFITIDLPESGSEMPVPVGLATHALRVLGIRFYSGSSSPPPLPATVYLRGFSTK